MEIDKIIADLKQERARLDQAISALEDNHAVANRRGRPPGAKPAATKPARGITPEGRRRLSIAMKKRWAERRKKSAKNT